MSNEMKKILSKGKSILESYNKTNTVNSFAEGGSLYDEYTRVLKKLDDNDEKIIILLKGGKIE